MKFSRVWTVIAAGFVAAGAAWAFTMPGATPYDGLITFDPAAMPFPGNAGHINGGVGYSITSKGFDNDSKAQDLVNDVNLLAVPIDLGYAFDERWLADVTVQLLQPSVGDTSTFGIGDVWVKARGVWETGNDFYLGPRLGIKIPVGKVDYADTNLELGDDQMDIDFGAVAAKYGGETHFKATGQLGFRYRMKYTYSEYEPTTQTTYSYDVTPGTLIYVDLAPGFGVGPNQLFQVYVPIGYTTSMKDKVDVPANWPAGVPEPEGQSHNALYVGLYPKYELDELNTIGVKALYTAMGKNVPQGMFFALTVNSYIPF